MEWSEVVFSGGLQKVRLHRVCQAMHTVDDERF
jgi:hypothetical protein